MISKTSKLNGKWLSNKVWKYVAFFVVLFCCCERNSVNSSLIQNNIGCLYVSNLCVEGVEYCFDDDVIGRCLAADGSDYYIAQKEYLDTPAQDEFSNVVKDVHTIVDRHLIPWSHEYIQCRLQSSLYAIANNLPYSREICWEKIPEHIPKAKIIPVNLEELSGAIEPQPENQEDLDESATIQFVPPNINYADEVYYPPMKRKHNRIQYEVDEESAPYDYRTHYTVDVEPNENADLEARIQDIKNRMELRRMLSEYVTGELKPPIFYKDDIVAPEDFRPIDDVEEIENIYERPHNSKRIVMHNQPKENENVDEFPLKSVFREHQRPQYIIEDIENDAFDRRNNDPEIYHRRLFKVGKPRDETSGGYTEGGLVLASNSFSAPQRKTDEDLDTESILADMLGFTRHERLDVKKPGPRTAPPIEDHPALNATKTKNEQQAETVSEKKASVLPKIKKLLHSEHDDDHAPHSVDTQFAHIIVKTPMDNWNDGTRVLAAIADMLNMKDLLTSIRVDRHEIAFRVEENPEKSASDVARAINDHRFKTNLSRRLGVTVLQAGVGNKTKDFGLGVSSSRLRDYSDKGNLAYLMPFMLAGAAAAAVVVIVITIFLLKGYDKTKYKLGDLQSSLSGPAEKDYQDLCRARMTGKASNMPIERTILSGTQNERPPSSRSSTSSWSEEPMTNMDISTGHMVLSYMEDHLKNKGRLQREWDVLCRYEAEPSAKDSALQAQCAQLNRPGAPLPYDHSRVVLNHLINAEGLDYINASTITDHDPRAPAYVAAQGPLPSTIAHFWQMIWEQGAVVIVALCRLQENNESACARYWPEEGSEVYHIYEVHLVSEHIWCDDYLVRSFYLKNLRTGETRTVTQFHFLSWPQNGIPTSAKALLDFRRKVNKSYRGRSCPIVVHGSAGAGRTGAYILLDLVLARMNKGAREIDIAATLEHLRDQRAALVATKQQFEFVLMAVAEEVHAILKALPQNTQSEKRELDKETVKEQEDEKEKTSPSNEKSSKEPSKK